MTSTLVNNIWKTCYPGTFSSCTQNIHFRTILWTSQFTPKPALFLIYICHNSGSTYYFFPFYKGRFSDFKLKINLKKVINFIVFDGWGQFIMMTNYHTKESIHYSDHLNCHTKGVNLSCWPHQTITARETSGDQLGNWQLAIRCHCCLHFNIIMSSNQIVYHNNCNLYIHCTTRKTIRLVWHSWTLSAVLRMVKNYHFDYWIVFKWLPIINLATNIITNYWIKTVTDYRYCSKWWLITNLIADYQTGYDYERVTDYWFCYQLPIQNVYQLPNDALHGTNFQVIFKILNNYWFVTKQCPKWIATTISYTEFFC